MRDPFLLGDDPWVTILLSDPRSALEGGRRLRGEATPPFRYRNRGDVAVIGRLSGVTDIPWLGPLGRTGGFLAWLLWLGIHIVYLIGFANRLVVLIRWAWSFLTHGRGTRLITGSELLPPIEEPEPPVLAPIDPDEVAVIPELTVRK